MEEENENLPEKSDQKEIILYDKKPKFLYKIGKKINYYFNFQQDYAYKYQIRYCNVHFICISHDNKYIITCDVDELIKMWDIQTGKFIRIFQVPSDKPDEIRSICIDHNGKYLLAGYRNNKVIKWDIDSGNLVKTFEINSQSGKLSSICLPPNDKYFFTIDWGEKIKMYDIDTGNLVKILDSHSERLSSMCISNDSKYIFIGDYNSKVKMLEIKTGNLIRIFEVNFDKKKHFNDYDDSAINSMCISKNGNYLFTLKGKIVVKVFKIDTGEEVNIFYQDQENSDEINSICISPDDKYLITGLSNSEISAKIWDIDTGKLVRGFERYSEVTTVTCISPNGKYLFTSGWDQSVRIWDINTSRLLVNLYNIDNGYLWATPPDEYAKSGWFFTDRLDLINVITDDGKKQVILPVEDSFRKAYINRFNDKYMVLNRLNNYQKYKEDLELKTAKKEMRRFQQTTSNIKLIT